MNFKKKIVSFLITFCMIAAFIPAPAVHAGTNLTNVSIYVGKSTTLKVYGVTKKVAWSSSKKAVATVKSTGTNTAKVTGKKAGVAKIYAKVSGKTYTCKVTVKKKVTTDYSKKITYESFETSKNLVLIFENNNTCNVYLEAKVLFYDSTGKILSQSEGSCSIFQKGKHTVLTFDYPKDSNYDTVEYANYKVKVTAKLPSSIYKGCAGSVDLNTNLGSNGGVMAECVNSGSKTISYIYLSCVYYKDGKVVGVSDDYGPSNLAAGDSDVVTFHAPYDAEYNDLAFDTYKVYIDYAYYYTV